MINETNLVNPLLADDLNSGLLPDKSSAPQPSLPINNSVDFQTNTNVAAANPLKAYSPTIFKIKLSHLRCFDYFELNDCQQFNIICGANGSGKSSILEAIYVLATGKSFRSGLIKPIIQNQFQAFTIYAQTADYHIGVSKDIHGISQIKVNQQLFDTQSELAKLLPVQWIDPSSVDLFFLGGSANRRQSLDWLLFHYDATFFAAWQQYQRLLKQRNKALKDPKFYSVLPSFSHNLAQAALLVHEARVNVFAQLQQHMAFWLQILLPHVEIHSHYAAGFDVNVPLQDILNAHQPQDIERGFTFYGPHRADIKFKTTGGDAEKILSRGQKKQLLLALHLAQISLLKEQHKTCIVLIDDFTAELDEQAQQRVLQALNQLNSQIFMSCLDIKHFAQTHTTFEQQAKVFYL